MNNDPRFPPVNLNTDWEGVQAFQYTPGSPHNLPAWRDRVPKRANNLIGAPAPATSSGTPVVNNVPTFDPHHYAQVSELQFAFDVASVSEQLLNEGAVRRNYLMIRNCDAAAIMYVSFGRDASLFSPLVLQPGEIVFYDTVVPQNDVFAMSDVAAAVMAVAVSTLPY